MRILIGFAGLVIVAACIIWVYSFFKCIDKLDKHIELMKSKVGAICVLNNDTLTIVDYNSINSTYTLSNGVTVSKEIVK